MPLNKQTETSIGINRTIVMLFSAVLVGAGAVYFFNQRVTTPDPAQVEASTTASSDEFTDEETIVMTLPTTQAERLIFVETLSNHLEDRPDEVSGWVVLARQLKMLNETEKSISAYKKANQLTHYADIDLLSETAEMLVVMNEGIIPHEALEMFNIIIRKEPNHPTANYFLGLQKVQDGDPAAGLAHWQAQLDAAPEGALYTPLLEERIEMLKQLQANTP